MKAQFRAGPEHIIKNWRFVPQFPSEKFYKRDFLEVFPNARVASAKVGDLDKIRARLYKEPSAANSGDEIGKQLCNMIADRLEVKINGLKDKEPIIAHEQDSHEFALPFLMALNSAFGTTFKVLSLDRHLDALANEFEYMSFWKFAISNKLMDPKNLMIFGPHQLIWAKEFISFFPCADRERFASGLMAITPSFKEKVLFAFRDQAWRDAIGEYVETHLPGDTRSQERSNILSSMLVFQNSEFAYRLRSFWEAEGLRRKGVLLELPLGFRRADIGSDEVFAEQLNRIKRFASNENLLISFDIDVALNPKRLYEMAEAIASAGTKRIALNIAGLNSRGTYPGGADNLEIKGFINRLY